MKILPKKMLCKYCPSSDNLSVWHMTLVEVGHFWLICNFYRAQSPHFDWATFIKKAKWGRWGIEENDRLKTICALFANSSSLLRATVWKFCCCSASSLLTKYCLWECFVVIVVDLRCRFWFELGNLQSSVSVYSEKILIRIGQSINIAYLSVTRMIT